VPELPEVETLRQDLAKEVTGRKIKAVAVANGRSVRRHASAKHFRALLEGRAIKSVGRVGKYLLLTLDNGDTLVVHLGMSGQLLRVKSVKEARPKHTHVVITFTQGGELRYVDPRTFGELFVSTPPPKVESAGTPAAAAGAAAGAATAAAGATAAGGHAASGQTAAGQQPSAQSAQSGAAHSAPGNPATGRSATGSSASARTAAGNPASARTGAGHGASADTGRRGVAELAHLGFDPIEDVMSWDRFAVMLRQHRTGLKALLMDQSFVAGIGNLYSDEILFAAGLRYDRTSASLSTTEVRRLYRAMVETLAEAIKHRGSTLADEQYRDLFGEVGDYQGSHQVYAREGQACRRCRNVIVRVKSGGRSAYFCEHCQV
jgi:formamidopyrimidine-DNA glycosylase